MPMGASLTPLRGTDSILWTVKFRNGETKRFKYPIRTTPWGSIELYQDLPDPGAEEMKKAGLCGEAKYLGVDKLPVLSND